MGQLDNDIGELEDIRWARVEQAVEAAKLHSDVIVGIKVRLTENIVGSNDLIALERALEAGQEVTGEEPFNFFMTLFYPADNLMILDYNRVLKSLNEMAPEEFMAALEENFTLRPLADGETSRV